MKLIINQKNYLTKKEIIECNRYLNNKNIIFMPELPYLLLFNRNNFDLASPTISKYLNKKITAEVDGKILKTIGVKYVLINKSRTLTNIEIRNSIKNTIYNEMIPILYLYEKDNTENISYIEEELEPIPTKVKYIIVVVNLIEKINDNNYLILLKIKDWLIERNINHSIIYEIKDNEDLNKINSYNIINGIFMDEDELNLNKIDNIYKKINN